MTRVLLDILGILLVLIGVAAIPLPTPGGIVLVVCGFIALILSEDWARRWVRTFRKRNRAIDQLFTLIKKRAPKIIAEAIRRTDP